ncbi:MAG: helix-turn-helix transcriptional regulator [Nocardiopsaceae bacterium]|jgi:transcriptional regulator with XRE-family HTH domain|nr:helix-turn-helix transcriptional regulator [Nocardiopsaceae bacterium]
MPNAALREARLRAHLSQDDLARRIREAGFRSGDPNGCTREMVQRWESGRTKCPQPRYLLALEKVLGLPAASLGFADEALGVDRGRALADAGLDTVLPLPDPAGRYGPLTGIWLSSYDYESSSRGRVYTSRHHVILLQTGARLAVRSVPASVSKVGMDLSVNGQVATGTWTEQTQQDGYYSGAVYHGAIQMILDPTGHRMSGQWAGFGRDFEINTGPWSLALVDADVSEDAIRRWDREPGEA